MATFQGKMIEADAQHQLSITEEQKQFFLENGFLVIRRVLVGEELKLIQHEMMEQVQIGITEGNKLDAKQAINPDYMFGKGIKTGKSVFKRVEYVVDKSEPMKVLLGHPFILRSIEKLQSANFIPTWDSMVLKMPNEGIIVPWHYDASPPFGCEDPRPIFNVDFYLDDADLKTCLWVIPGSQSWSEEKSNERCSRPGFDTSDAIPVPLQAGDVIFHNIRVLHGSPAGDGNPLRRTVYYEFRPIEIEDEYGPHTSDYIPKKQQVLLSCIDLREKASYAQHETPFVYSPTGKYKIDQVKRPETFRYAHADYWRST